MTEQGFLRLEYDISRSGMQTPYHIAYLARVPFAAANIGLGGAYISQTKAVVRLLDHYPNIQCKESLIGDMLHGASYGAVCLSEKHSNISLTDIRSDIFSYPLLTLPHPPLSDAVLIFSQRTAHFVFVGQKLVSMEGLMSLAEIL